MTEEEYKAEWKLGFHQTEYNNCRFADDKVQYLKDWFIKEGLFKPQVNDFCTNFIANAICKNKLRIAEDPKYRYICRTWTDKIAVYELLQRMNMGNIAIPLIHSSHDRLTQTNIMRYCGTTPAIIKCNHGSGWNVIRKPFQSTAVTTSKINEWLKLNYAYICGYEAQYEDIQPGYIIQPLLHEQPIDYGFWCKDKKILAVSMTKKLGKNLEEYLSFTDVDGNALDWYVGMQPEMGNLPSKFKTNISMMLPYVQDIANLFDFVRVDMYCINGKVYFGEATCTPCGGKVVVTYKH